MITAGIESGAKNTKVVIMDNDKILCKNMVLTGFDQRLAVARAFEDALKAGNLSKDKIEKIGATGSGKDFVEIADVNVNDIKAMGKAANYFFSNARTVVDVGSEEGRTVKINENGDIEDFVINEKCAAGAGSFIEAMARALEVDLEKMGPLALTSDKEIGMNAQCVVFAESEVVGLIHAKTATNDISRAIHDSMASRIVSMIRRIGVNEDIVVMGGVGRNPGFITPIQRELNVEKIYVPDEPEFGPALGAALIAAL